MSFDGEYQTERPEFETVEEVWDYANDLGSKWYFYPFYFVVTASAKTIVDVPPLFEWAKGKRVKSVVREFKRIADAPESANMGVEEFAFASENQTASVSVVGMWLSVTRNKERMFRTVCVKY